jgi:hypothetical protein
LRARDGISVAETVYARAFVQPAGMLCARKDGYQQLDRVAAADGLMEIYLGTRHVIQSDDKLMYNCRMVFQISEQLHTIVEWIFLV